MRVARSREAVLNADAHVAAWMRDDAHRDVATLDVILRASTRDRAALAAADASLARSDSLIRTGNLAGARRLIESHLAVRKRVLGGTHPEVASRLAALTQVAITQGDMRRTYELASETFAMRRRVLGARHPDVASSLFDMGVALKSTDDRAAPMRCFRQSLAIREDAFGPDAPEVMESLRGIANVHRVAQRPDSALAIYTRVLRHYRRSGERPAIADVLFSMAMTVTPLGQWGRAEPWLREASGYYREAGPANRQSLARCLGSYGTALRHLGRPREAERVLEECTQVEETVRRNAPQQASRAAWFSLVSYCMLAAAQLDAGHEREAWPTMEHALGRTLLENLAARGAVDTVGWWDGALARVQGQLPSDAAVVGWLALRPAAGGEGYPYWCYCIRSSGPVLWRKVARPAGGPVASDSALGEVGREWIRTSAWPLRVTDTRAIVADGRAAYDQRFAPLEPWLAGVRTLVVVAADFVRGAPVELWVDDNGVSLADRFTIMYTPSALLFAESTRRARRRTTPFRALVVGPGAGSSRATRLAGAEDETRDVAALLATRAAVTGPQPTESLRRLARSGAIGRFDVIHIATHATANSEWVGQNAMILSPEARDHLTVGEIMDSWRLHAELVTLASCEAAAGASMLQDGPMGFQFAFLSAGARCVVASLRAVDDRGTELFMAHFYEALLRDTREDGPFREARALAAARRWVRAYRAPDGSTPYAHPAYWAGFTLMTGGCAPPRRD